MPDRIYHILLVEDSKADVGLYKEVLRDWNTRHCLYVADNGHDALDLLHNRGNHDGAPRPDLIFLDLNLPKISGFEVLRSVREDERPEISVMPVIVVTSSCLDSDVTRAYDHGANAFIAKPIHFEESNEHWMGSNRSGSAWLRASRRQRRPCLKLLNRRMRPGAAFLAGRAVDPFAGQDSIDATRR